MLLTQHWPLFNLHVRTPRLELRYPTDDEVAEIAERAVSEGVHDPSFMPFSIEWTDVPAPLQQRRALQHHWGHRASWEPTSWMCNFVVVVEGQIVGSQSVGADNFNVLRCAVTGSYLLQPFQNKGLGTEMRSAILHLIFAGLQADRALTGSWEDNAQSLGVTQKLGYEVEGRRRMISRGQPREMVGYRLTRAAWETHRRDDVSIEGLAPCLEMFGLSNAAPGSTAARVDGS